MRADSQHSSIDEDSDYTAHYATPKSETIEQKVKQSIIRDPSAPLDYGLILQLVTERMQELRYIS